MNFQIPNDVQPEAAQPQAEVEELAEALSAGDATFVDGAKKPGLSAGTLGLAGVLAACGAVVALMYLRNGPQAAGAAEAPPNLVVADFLNNAPQQVSAMRQMLQSSDGLVQRFRDYSSRPQIPLGKLQTNPFRQLVPTGVKPEAESEAAARRRREQERLEVLKTVESLQLQSVLRGSRQTACMINNALYQQGQQVEGFTVEQITGDAVIVRKGSYRFELRMGK